VDISVSKKSKGFWNAAERRRVTVEELNGQVLKGFGVKAKRVVKEKAHYICQTSAGPRVIRKSFDSRDSICFQYELQQHLYNAGFVWTDRYYMSGAGKPYFDYDDNVYVMTDLLDYRESDFASAADIRRLVPRVAHMHRLCASVPLSGVGVGRSPSVTEHYAKSAAELTAIKKRLSNQKRLSDFDVLFLKNYNYYLKLLKQSLALLEATDYAARRAAALADNMICHNLLKEENVLIDNEDVYITRFSGAAVDYFLIDVALILRRVAKNASASVPSVAEVLELYDRHNPLNASDIAILQPLIKYPADFIKICGQYYDKKRTWAPSAVLGRMEAAIELRERGERYVAGYSWE
jgi:CotS family spore coat protein